jgi:TonB family protein
MATQASDTANNTASKRGRGASPDDLAVVAQRAQAFTNASGVAIALSEGNADEIVCRARSGASAPEVGAALRVNGTFTGLCIQTGKELRCDDCETDTRVDTAAIRALGIRSMVVTPIREENRVVGVLAAFAPTPHAFTITHVAVLKTMADQISALLQKERRAREENPQMEAPRPTIPAITAKPVVVPTPTPPAVQATPPAVVIKPSGPRGAATAPAKAEPIKSAPLEVVPLATPPKKEEKRIDAAPRANFGTFDSMAAEERKPANRFMMIGVVAVLVIAAASTFAFLKMQKPKTAAAPQQTQEAANVPPGSLPPANNAQPVSSTVGGTAPTAATSTIAMPPASKVVAEKPSGKAVAEKNPPPGEKPAEKPASVATLGSTGASRIAKQNIAQATPDVAPSFIADTGNSSAPLSSLARPVVSSAPSAAAIEQSQLEPIQVVKTGPLVYPAIAKARNITGPAVVQVTVGKDGKPYNPQYISGQPVFRDAAIQAVMGYVFKPAKLNGQPIEQSTRIRLNFH